MLNEEFVEMKGLRIQFIIDCEALLEFKAYCFYMGAPKGRCQLSPPVLWSSKVEKVPD